jgi:hypothetical protein
LVFGLFWVGYRRGRWSRAGIGAVEGRCSLREQAPMMKIRKAKRKIKTTEMKTTLSSFCLSLSFFVFLSLVLPFDWGNETPPFFAWLVRTVGYSGQRDFMLLPLCG